jgi:c-di-GMP-binding flagellar brake protein YcgR
MFELRRAPRANVSWRAAIKLAEKNIVPAKISNVSQGGMQIICPYLIQPDHDYQMMIEVPALNNELQHFQVLCNVAILHAILSEDTYRIGAKFSKLSALHQELIMAWISKVL